MKLNKYIAITALGACAFGASAQNTYSGYFVDDYTYRFK